MVLLMGRKVLRKEEKFVCFGGKDEELAGGAVPKSDRSGPACNHNNHVVDAQVEPKNTMII